MPASADTVLRLLSRPPLPLQAELRVTEYASAIAIGAPAAVPAANASRFGEVADRWHPLANLHQAVERWLAWGLLLAVLALAAPALLLHLRYYTLKAATTLLFNPLEGRLQVALDEVRAYDPARQGWPGPEPVEWRRCRWPGVFWRRYEYLRLPLPQGDIILTSLVLPDMHLLVRYLRHFGVEVQEKRRAWAWA